MPETECPDIPIGKPLTPTQTGVLNAIVDLIDEHRHSPTMDELAERIGVSKVTIFEHLKAIEKKGWITRDRHMARSIRVVGRCPHCGRKD